MKKIFISLLLSVGAALASSAQAPTLKNLIGKWESSDGGGIEVVDSVKIFLVYNGEKKQINSYQCDFSKTPCWFDFTIKDSAANMTMKSLLLFVSDDLLQWQVFDDNRPSDFNVAQGDIVYLRRKR